MAARDQSGTGRFAPPPPGSREEQTGVQSAGNGRYKYIPPFMENALTLGLLLLTPGGTASNPMGFPGYEGIYTGNPVTYRWMLQHPILRLVRSIRMGMIAANSWEYEKVDKNDNDPALKEWLAFTKTTFDPIRQSLIWDFMARAHDYGWTCGEPVWEYRDGRYRLARVKPLLQDITEVLTDDGGTPVALRNHVSRGINSTGPVDLSIPYKAFHWAYDSEAGYVYGRSWLENVRNTAWKGWLDKAQQIQKLGGKISGTVTIITSPAGTFPGPAGQDGKPTQISFRKNAEEVIKALANGAAGAWFPSLGLNPDGKGGLDAMKVMAQLIGKSMTNVDVKDFPGSTRAIQPLLEGMKHDEELMFAGGLRPARVGLEAEHGSRADAGEHTNTATFNAESDDEVFARGLQPLVDADLTLNFTPKAKGRVRIKPPSLVDRKTAIYKALLLGLINDPDVASQMARTPGLMDSLLTVLDVVSEGKFDVAEFKKRQADKEAAKTKPPTMPPGNVDPQGGRPPAKE